MSYTRKNKYGGYGSQQYGPMPSSSYQQRKKHSGAKMGMGKNGLNFISAWNYSRRFGLITLIGSHRKEGANKNGTLQRNRCVNRKGEELLIYSCTLNVPMQSPRVVTGFFNPNDNKLRIPDLAMVVSPYAPNGGYFGRIKVKR